MTTLTEGNLQIIFPRGATARKFDDKSSHGLPHCMEAVDFIVELTDRVLFIKIKDPQHPLALENDSKKFIDKFLAGSLGAEKKYKYRDSFLYELAFGNAGKPISYLVLIAIGTLTNADILTRTDALKRKLPLQGPPSGKWKQSIVADCMVFNIQTWNQFLPRFQVSRIEVVS